MKQTKDIVVKNDSENTVPTEVIAESIVTIAEGMKKLRSGRLNDRALLLLIQHAAPNLPTNGYGNTAKVGMREIKAVIEGLESLEATFLKKKA